MVPLQLLRRNSFHCCWPTSCCDATQRAGSAAFVLLCDNTSCESVTSCPLFMTRSPAVIFGDDIAAGRGKHCCVWKQLVSVNRSLRTLFGIRAVACDCVRFLLWLRMVHVLQSSLLSVLLVHLCCAQVAPPVDPIYNIQDTVPLYTSYPPERLETCEEMGARGAIQPSNWAFYSSANHYAHCANTVRQFEPNMTELLEDKSYLPGTTYWMNDYLHVGHVHYDIGLIAVAQAEKLDRIVMQRAACHGTLCVGLGSFDSFYKGYFDTPVYIRFDGKQKGVIPLHLTTNKSTDYYNASMMQTSWNRPIELYPRMHFQRAIRRSNLNYGSIGAVSAEAVQRFKAAAYALIPCDPPLTTYFTPGPPYRILVAFRGNKASRQIENMGEFEHMLRTSFPAPDYILRMLNTSDPYLAFDTQLHAVAEAHVVIANHGAFEGNMIYMRNSSLLVELFGNYGNNEIHTFQRLAIMFGLYYARLHAESLVDHQAPYFNLSSVDLGNIKHTLGEYFERKPYLRNLEH